MAATRRTTTTRVEVPLSNGNKTNTSSTTNTANLAPSTSPLPTALEGIILALYPLTLLLGSAYGALDPSTRASIYLTDAQSYDPAHAPSYFAKKSNVFNVYFVKIGWLWATAAFLALVFTHQRAYGSPANITHRRRLQALARYAAITTLWVFVTQWCFGPALIDRSFRWTGGQCALAAAAVGSEDGEAAGNPALRAAARAKFEDDPVREVFTHAACKAIGGTWRGGHDISGHVFLLILCSGMLWLEVLPWSSWREEAAVGKAEGAAAKEKASVGIGGKFALGVAALSWWMLFMTAAYFHTWFEKVTGLLVAFSALYVVYFLPRGVPVLRSVLGRPGV